MDPQDLIDAAIAALGLDSAAPMTQGGHKVVYRGTFNGVDAVAKIVLLPPGPIAAVALERPHREVGLLAALHSPNVLKVLNDAIEVGAAPEAICWVEEFLDGTVLTMKLQTKWGMTRSPLSSQTWQPGSPPATNSRSCML